MKYYSAKTVTQLLGVTAQTLRNWDKEGKLKPAYTKSNGYRYYSEEDVLRLSDSDDYLAFERNLFKGVVLELKTEYGHMCYFTTGTADISYGVLTEVYQGSRIKSSYIELRKIAEVRVTSIDRKTFTTIQKVRG